MPFYVLIPDDVKEDEKRKCVIAVHGHESGGKYSVAVRTDIPAVKKQIEHYNYDHGVRSARKGYIVFCPDVRGFGECREWMKQKDDVDSFLTSTCVALNNMAICLGQSLVAMWTRVISGP